MTEFLEQVLVSALSGGVILYIIERTLETKRRKRVAKNLAEILATDVFRVRFLFLGRPDNSTVSRMKTLVSGLSWCSMQAQVVEYLEPGLLVLLTSFFGRLMALADQDYSFTAMPELTKEARELYRQLYHLARDTEPPEES